MPKLPHLTLPKAEYNLPRKKLSYGRARDIDNEKHGKKIEREINQTLDKFKAAARPRGIDPSLILRIQLDQDSIVDEKTWLINGLHLLSVDEGKSLVLFSEDAELQSFLERLNKYKEAPPEGQKNASHAGLFSAIASVGAIEPKDRIGRVLRSEGITSTDHFIEGQVYILDVELWPIEPRHHLELQIEQIRGYIEGNDGEISDIYTGAHLVLMRASCSGEHVRELLNIESVESIDFPPRADIVMEEVLNLTINDFADIPKPPDDASALAIFDSGITSGHPFLAPAIGEATAIPAELGDGADIRGHGTRVGGIALYNNIRECVDSSSFIPKLKIYSAKVVGDDGKFSDKKLIMSQMTDAIKYFNDNYNCRVFNISLGDKKLIYDGGKIGGWATVLDALSRELDIVVIVAAGNYTFQLNDGDEPDSVVNMYPDYLLQDDARIVEPATGAIVVTVGSICESEELPVGNYGVEVKPIAHRNEPSPFTRRGPGCGGAIKPEFCDFGGNAAFDGLLQGVRKNISELSSLTLNHEYLNDLLATTVGTSFSAPRVAHKAAMLLNTYPEASANLIRALLASSSEMPIGATARLGAGGYQATLDLLGYGQPDIDRAVLSDENRVVMYVEEYLEHDNFHIFEIPIIDEFIQTNGKRAITVSMAFDPPVRHTRIDYMGVKMSFRLIRGKSVDEVAESFRHRGKEEVVVDSFSGTRFDCTMKPGPNQREGGTLQKASFITSRTPQNDYGETYYLVVRCEKKWASDEDGPQRYSVVVQIEHEAEINLHAQIQQRIQPPVRVRV